LFGGLRATIPVRIIDLSLNGTSIEVPYSLRPGAACEVSLPIADGELVIPSSVLRCTSAGHGMFLVGLEFPTLDANQVQVLEDMIVEISLSKVDTNPGDKTAKTSDSRVKIRIDANQVQPSGTEV